MKLAAFTNNSQSFVKYGDTSTVLHVQISEDGTFVDLTQAKSISIPIANIGGLIFTKTIDPTTLQQGGEGIVDFTFTQDDETNLPPDEYFLEIWVTNQDGTVGIYPAADNQLTFSITNNLTVVTGGTVSAVALSDFQDAFAALQSQVADSIHNGLKGDKGDKGDTGQGLEIKDKISDISNLPATANEGDGYLVGEELYVWISGAWKDCGPIQGPQGIQGPKGDTGNTGNGVSSTTIQYQISNSPTVTPTGTWSNNIIAPTQDNPYLWLQATLNYTDGTSKTFYLISEKGDKGDKGDQGIQGIQGEKGDTGAGLQVKGRVNDVSQLPATGQDGYCYFVGTDMYVWTNNQWNNMGDISPDLSNYVTLTDMNNGLATKVTDNKDGTEQLNGVQIQPFNKTSDTVGVRNYLVNSNFSDGVNNWNWQYFSTNPDIVTLNGKNYIHWVSSGLYSYPGIWQAFSGNFKKGDNILVSLLGHVSDSSAGVSVIIHEEDSTGNTISQVSGNFPGITTSDSRQYLQVDLDVDCLCLWVLILESNYTLKGVEYWLTETKVSLSDANTDWSPAPEDVATTNDVTTAISTKQDKLSYVPADDSKVVHTADMRKPASDVVGLEEVSTAVNQSELTDGMDIDTLTTEGVYPFTGKTLVNAPTTSKRWGVLKVTFGGDMYLQELYTDDNIRYWRFASPALNWSAWHTAADDSKVAHLSGANNFDTVPTVNNNPVATTDDVTTASNTVLTSANTSISKLLQSSSNNDEDSAVTNSTSDTSNFYYWTE